MRYLSLFGLVVVLTACGGNTSSSSPRPTPSDSTPASTVLATPTSSQTSVDSTAALREAVKAYSDAFLSGHADAAYALLSARCQERESPEAFGAIVAAAKAAYGQALPLRSFRAQVSGDLARVTYTYDVAEINQDSEPWVREGGHWHEDDC